MIATQCIVDAVRDLPTLPAAAMRLAELARDERSSSADFERAIRPDPALTANLLRIANSAYFGLRARVDSVRNAVTLLGLRRVSEMAAAAAFAQTLPARIPGYGMDAGQFWLHSVAVAVLAERLAVETQLPRPDSTFTAGLLHDVGKLAVAAFVSSSSADLFARVRAGAVLAEAEREVLGLDHAQVGELVASAWSLPPAVAAVARWHHTPDGLPLLEHRRLVDLVHAADALAHAMGLGADRGELARKVESGASERMGLRARALERVAGESLDAIRDMAALFAPSGGRR